MKGIEEITRYFLMGFPGQYYDQDVGIGRVIGVRLKKLRC